MESKSSFTFKSPIFSGLLLVFFPLLISTGALLQFGAPSDERLNLTLLFMATVTFFLGMTLLPLRLSISSTKPLNPTFTRLTNHLATATVTASFNTLILSLRDASMDFPNLNIFSHWIVAWAYQCGLILVAIAVVYKLINEILTSLFRQCVKVVFFTLCVALAGLYTEPLFPLPCTFPYNCVMYRTYHIYHSALVPFAFVLGTILLILGVVAPNDSPSPFISVIFKEAFAMFTLSVACITLLIGASLMVSASLLNPAMVSGVGAMEVGAM